MKATDWDERYSRGRLWSTEANRWVIHELSGMPPGKAVDVACGEGRNSLWLADQGWSVVAVDFSQVALDRGHESQLRAREEGRELDIHWVNADITADGGFRGRYDLALVSYVHLEAYERTPLLRAAASTLAPGGILLVVAHDSSNLVEGHGGPDDPALLYTARDVADDLQDMVGSGALVVERADRVAREVETDEGTRIAWDALFRARRPDTTKGEFSFA
ncbi:class I SAM-dependent methyltransferase [Austwickia chelonae]|uniref:class I SAM-dependent methyltransferase n=1 Tax=Austwickia chelonae TaxID=100225 RepID=UPI000E265D49|nr:class I SAM-dependent methyltransferase [Austwickia chelonae]